MATPERLSWAAVVFFGAGALALGAGVALIQTSCIPDMAAGVPTVAIPTAPIPTAPDVQLPTFEPPAVTAPEGPDVPPAPENKGNCCIRTGRLLREKCGNALSCCTDAYKEKGTCVEQKGLWFFTPEGCAGAC